MCECVLWQWHGTHEVKLNGKCWFLHGHVTFQFLSLIAQNLLLAYYRFEFKANYYNTADITLGSKCTTDRTLLPLGSKCYYGWDINYAWVRLLHFCQYGGVQKLPKITTAQILVNPKSHSVIRFWALDASFSLPLNFFFFHSKVTRFISFIVDYTLLCTLNICPVLLADQSENCTASRPRAATYNISGETTVIGNHNTVNQY